MSEVGDKLLSLRTERKLALNEVCRKAGIPPSRLVEIERGVRIATPGQIERLENFYEVKSGEIRKKIEPFNIKWIYAQK
jgi:transcriptional regulator with XRE-family HTH domain